MGYKFLVGAKTLKGWAVVDVNQNFLAGEVSEAELKQAYHLERFAGSVAKTLNIAVLASNPGLYSNRRLLEAAKQRGHNIRFVHISQCFMKMEKDSYSLHYRGEGSMDAFDAVMPRIRPDITFYATSVLRQFAALGVYCLNSAEAIQLSRDKLLAYQILAQRGIPIPQTGFANSPDDTKQLIQLVGGAPLVIKLLQSTQGKGVILADTNKGAESAINAFKNLGANILVQEYIKESKGRDIRAFVVGKEVVAAMERVASDAEEFRSNIHLGAVGRPVMLTKEQKKIAVSAAKILGLQVAGVDLIPSDSGIKVLEVNSSPGLEGIEQATGIDVAGKIVEYLESRLAHK